jgi:hypothetical protein
MDPSSFTKTPFCNVQIDNITTNESKQYILNQMSLLCSGIKYNSRYAKVFNAQFSKNLNNHHVFFLKSSGTPYLLFLSQINGINYAFLIDKKIKEGYDYPKIFILPYIFSSELYKGSLFECELIRKKNKKWCIGINDIYFNSGKNLKKTIIIDRMNTLHKILSDNYNESEFTKTCPLFIKKYFDYKDINFALHEFAPNLEYNTRGLYFVPLRVDYSNILYIFPKESTPVVMKEINKTTKCFRIMKTMKPDVYELYLSNGDNIVKQGIALVQTTLLSHTLLHYFKDKSFDEEILVECKYDTRFEKWEPVSLSEGPIDIS